MNRKLGTYVDVFKFRFAVRRTGNGRIPVYGDRVRLVWATSDGDHLPW